MRLLVLIGFFLIAHSMCAQNLVPNPSFEDHDSCPQHNGDLFCALWYSPTDNTPDYLNECWNGTWYDSQDVPVNMVGSEPAHSGVAYAGFTAYYSSVNARDYLSVKLLDTLKAGQTYQVEFYITLGDSSMGGTNLLGVHFSSTPDTAYAGFNIFNLPFQPQVEFDTIIIDTANWVKLSGRFVANGGECYLTIGVFKPDSSLQYDVIQGDSSIVNAYYFIDDVSVWNWDTPLVTYNNFTLYPNPSNGEFNISGDFPPQTQLTIYNMLGQKIGESIVLPEGNNIISVDLELAQGVYYYVLRSPIEQVAEGRFIITD